MQIKHSLTALQFKSLVTIVRTIIITIAHQKLGNAVSICACKLTGIACFDLILCTRTKKSSLRDVTNSKSYVGW